MRLKMVNYFRIIPPKKHKLVVAWIEIHDDNLKADNSNIQNSEPMKPEHEIYVDGCNEYYWLIMAVD